MKNEFKQVLLASLLFSGLANANSNSWVEPKYRLLTSGLSNHSEVDDGYFFRANEGQGEVTYSKIPYNSNHNAAGIYRKIDGLKSFDNEYIGITSFKNSYYKESLAISYEHGSRIKDNLVLGVRYLAISGYKKNENESSLFLTDDISVAATPFARFESSEGGLPGFFIEASMADIEVPVISFGLTF